MLSTPSIQFVKSRLRNPVAEQHAVLVLAMTAVLSALIYWLMFTRPFGLIALQHRPLFDLYHAAQTDPLIMWKQILAFLTLGGLYWLGWHAALRAHGRTAWAIVLSGAMVFGLLLLFMYPYDAADIFDNIMHGRISGVYGANPFLVVSAQFTSDPFLSYTAWPHTISAYGPLWEMLAGGVARLTGDGLLANVLAFKLVLGGALAVCAVLIALILRRVAPERMLAGVVFLIWNPVVVFETIGNGHNDVAMLVGILLAAWWLLQRRYPLMILALLVGALIKFIPLLLVPIGLAIALRDLLGWRARLRFAWVTLGAAVILITVAYAPFWRGPDPLSIERRASLFTTSLPAVLYFQLSPALGADDSTKWISLAALISTLIFALAMSARAWRDRSDLSFARSAFYLLMFYLLLTCLWFQHWYAVWPLALAALLLPGHAPRLAALFSYTALSKELIFAPLLLWPRPLPLQALRETWLGPAVMSIAWGYAVFALWDTWRKKRRRL